MESFAASWGAVPAKAERLLDDEARAHGAPWIQRLLGKGIACDYVIGYACGTNWWTFCFDRRPDLEVPDDDGEVWKVEAYDSTGRGRSHLFTYSFDSDRWNLLLIADPKDPRRLASALHHGA